MDETNELIAGYSLAAGAVLLLAAAFFYLVRATNRVPRGQRLAAMATIAWSAVRRRLPSRRSVAAAAAGFGAFFASGILCAAVCWGLLLWYASTQPEEINVVAGAAGAMQLTFFAVMGLGFSLTIGTMSGLAVAASVSNRLSRPQ